MNHLIWQNIPQLPCPIVVNTELIHNSLQLIRREAINWKQHYWEMIFSYSRFYYASRKEEFDKLICSFHYLGALSLKSSLHFKAVPIFNFSSHTNSEFSEYLSTVLFFQEYGASDVFFWFLNDIYEEKGSLRLQIIFWYHAECLFSHNESVHVFINIFIVVCLRYSGPSKEVSQEKGHYSLSLRVALVEAIRSRQIQDIF